MIWMKRDDLLGFAVGGNKVRKLDFLIADALAKGADTLITCGAVQSNHCRLTAAAAAIEGLACRLVLEEVVPNSYRRNASGNNLLFHLLGAERIEVVASGDDVDGAMRGMVDELTAAGRTGYVIAGGGSTALGALGYVACAQEIHAQSVDLGVHFDAIICASGSAGTHAGLLAGITALNIATAVVGVSVRRAREEQARIVGSLLRDVLVTLKYAGPSTSEITVLDNYIGSGYSMPTREMIEAVTLVARSEGILLDPVYTGKAMAGLVDQVRRGRFGRSENVLFLHTGGTPALYVYEDSFLSGRADDGWAKNGPRRRGQD